MLTAATWILKSFGTHWRRGGWLLTFLALSQGCCGIPMTMILDARQDDNSNCQHGQKGKCTTTTSGRTGTPTTSRGRPTRTSSASAAATTSRIAAGGTKRGGLSIAGIVGLVIGLLILLGLIVLSILKRRERLRHKRKLPRGITFLNPTPVNPPNSSTQGTEMGHTDVSAATFMAPAHLRGAPPETGDFGRHSNIRQDGTITSLSPLIPNDSNRRASGGSFVGADNDAHRLSYLYDAFPQPPPPQTAVLPVVAMASQRPLPGTPPLSTLHGEMEAYQKALEQDDHKVNQQGGSGTHAGVHDPPPVYTQ